MVKHTPKPIPDVMPSFRYPWREMSVGSHFTIRSHDEAFRMRAVQSMINFRKKYAPYARFIHRRTPQGFTFWRVSDKY